MLLNTLREDVATGVMAAVKEPDQNNTIMPVKQSSWLAQSKMNSAQPMSEERKNESATRDLKLQCRNFGITSSMLKPPRNALQS